MRVLNVPTCLLLLLTCVSSFTTHRYNPRFGVASTQKISLREITSLFSTDDTVEESESSEKSVSEPPAPVEPEGTSYPIDLPSPLLLSVSMVLAIAGTGKDRSFASLSAKFSQFLRLISICLF
jgi:hypothetical protein